MGKSTSLLHSTVIPSAISSKTTLAIASHRPQWRYLIKVADIWESECELMKGIEVETQLEFNKNSH